jgi:hypothetical protein
MMRGLRASSVVCPVAETTRTLAAADEVARRTQRSLRAAELAVGRPRAQAERAERAHDVYAPENRLVASTLDSCWQTRLAEAEQALRRDRGGTGP